jgi:hypothetical protein
MDRGANAAIFALVLVLYSPPGALSMPQITASHPNAAQQSSSSAQAESSHKGGGEHESGSAMHSITVQFDYDFTKTPACSAKITTACVQKFDVFDISGDKPYYLFSVPVPPSAQGMMKGISATSPRMLFAVGKHRIGVSAQMPDGAKSPPRDCKVVIEIKADNPPNPPASQ